MAVGIVHNVENIDHVALVTNPADKRCVPIYDNKGEVFKIIKYLSFLIRSSVCHVLDFDKAEFLKKKIPNPAYKKIDLNSQCFCKSGKKFKNCCVNKEYIEKDHIDIVVVKNRYI